MHLEDVRPAQPEKDKGIMSDPIYGTVFHLFPGNDGLPIMEMVSAPDVERTHGKRIAAHEFESIRWQGPKQVIFMRRDGWLEIWTPGIA